MFIIIQALVACAPTPAKVELSGEERITVHELSEVATPSAKVLDAEGAEIPDQKVEWAVADANIAKLSDDGSKIVALADGETTVSAKLGELSDSVTIVVSLPDAVEIGGAPADSNVAIGTPVALTGAVKADGTALEGKAVTWESSDAAIATVDAGNVTGVAAGSVTITAKHEALSATVTLNVVAAPPAP